MDEIRTHPSPLIQSAIEHVLSRMDPNDRGGVIAYADGEKVRGAVYANLGAGFSFVGIVEKSYDREMVYAAELLWKW